MPRRASRFMVIVALFNAAALLFAYPAYGQWTERVRVRHAAYAVEGAPSALVHAPAGFDATKPLQVVVFLHGLTGCAEVLMGRGKGACRPGEALRDGWDLASVHDAAQKNTLLVIPQLAFMRRDRRAGRFAQEGCFRTFLSEMLDALPSVRLGGHKTLADIGSITLVAHSAGYYTAAALLRHGGVLALIRSVVLFDALYNETDTFLAWIAAAPARARLVSLHLGTGAPARNSAWLLRAVRRKLRATGVADLDGTLHEPDFASALRDYRVVIARVKGTHQKVPEAYLATLLKALELPSIK